MGLRSKPGRSNHVLQSPLGREFRILARHGLLRFCHQTGGLLLLRPLFYYSFQTEPITFYDSVTGKPLFKAPIGRTMSGFLKESQDHGWPSFRDEEVVWENVRCLENGEAVSLEGSHLGHNLPDNRGNRYCINLVSVAGKPAE